MLNVETPAIPFYVRLSEPEPHNDRRSATAMEQEPAMQVLVCQALAGMVPSTAAEVARVTGLDPATAETCLERLAARYRVMFNPLTKRYSLPRVVTHSPIAA